MSYSFCPKCGQSLAVRLLDGYERLVCASCGFVLYQNSRPTSSVLVLNHGQLLLVKRGIEPLKGWWDIPGGFLEGGEHPEAGAVRETAEETGLLVEPVELSGIFMDSYGESGEYTLNLCYFAELVGGRPRPASDVVELQWFGLDALPAKIAFDWSQETLAMLRQRYQGS